MGPLSDDGNGGYGKKSEAAVAELRRRIVSGELPPGAQLKQDELGIELGQSRVPVREALKALTAENMVVHRPNRGHFVAELTADEMADVCWMRETLEAELARTARPVDARGLTRLQALNDEMVDLVGRHGAPAEYVELDDTFHEILWRLSPRRTLIDELRRVANQQRPYRVLLSRVDPERDAGAVQEHGEIVAALRAGDTARYQALLALHVARGRAMVPALEARGS